MATFNFVVTINDSRTFNFVVKSNWIQVQNGTSYEHGNMSHSIAAKWQYMVIFSFSSAGKDQNEASDA